MHQFATQSAEMINNVRGETKANKRWQTSFVTSSSDLAAERDGPGTPNLASAPVWEPDALTG